MALRTGINKGMGKHWYEERNASNDILDELDYANASPTSQKRYNDKVTLEAEKAKARRDRTKAASEKGRARKGPTFNVLSQGAFTYRPDRKRMPSITMGGSPVVQVPYRTVPLTHSLIQTRSQQASNVVEPSRKRERNGNNNIGNVETRPSKRALTSRFAGPGKEKNAADALRKIKAPIYKEIDFRKHERRLARYVQMKKYVSRMSVCRKEFNTINSRPVTAVLGPNPTSSGKAVMFTHALGRNYRTQNSRSNAVVNKKLGEGSFGEALTVRGVPSTWMSMVKFAVKVAKQLDDDFFTEVTVLTAVTESVKDPKTRFINMPMMYGSGICDPDKVMSFPGPIEDRLRRGIRRRLREPQGVIFAEKASGALNSWLRDHVESRRRNPSSMADTQAEAKFTTQFKSCILQAMLAFVKLRELKYYHADAHDGNILYHDVKPGGYWWYQVNGKDIYVKNEGLLCVLWDFGMSKPIDFSLHESKTSTVDMLHLMHYLYRATAYTPQINRQIKDFVKEIHCLVSQPAEDELGKYWHYFTNTWAEHFFKGHPDIQPDDIGYFRDLRVAPQIDHDEFIFKIFKLVNGISASTMRDSPALQQALESMERERLNDRPFIIKTQTIPGRNDLLRSRMHMTTVMHRIKPDLDYILQNEAGIIAPQLQGVSRNRC